MDVKVSLVLDLKSSRLLSPVPGSSVKRIQRQCILDGERTGVFSYKKLSNLKGE